MTLIVAAIGLLSGCASTRVENAPLEEYVRGAGYGGKFASIPHGDQVKVVLAFSGGGTRAAALAYGVMKELRKTTVDIEGKATPLLDQVSEISSVSGGSFTAAYYGLYSDGIFDDFEDRFLRKDIDARLALNLFRPWDVLKIWFTPYTRSDMAIDLYEKEVFGGATFADLERAGGPMLNINATDIDVGGVFTFMQADFNLICSDLSKMRVAQAVTASSAVPGIFKPLLIENRAGTCGHPEPEWIKEALDHPYKSRRKYHQARSAATYLDREKRPYIFLLDGGIADNIGARRIMANVLVSGGIAGIAGDEAVQLPEHVVYIVVNAQVGGKHDWDTNDSIPSFRSVLSAVSGTGIYRYNFETIELLRESVEQWSKQAAEQGHTMDSHVVEVAFDDLDNAADRKFFNGVATSFNLDDSTVDRLIEVGGQLLRDSRDFKLFLASME